jgi:hypothetical protein
VSKTERAVVVVPDVVVVVVVVVGGKWFELQSSNVE